MRKELSFLSVLLFLYAAALSQAPAANDNALYFVSDTQQPMFVEKLLLKPNHNKAATADIFSAILKDRPQSLYMLGDVVGLGCSRRKWKKVDVFLDNCRKDGTAVCGLLGNHEVMARTKRGERFFQQRFPMNINTGYYTITDSVAVVMLNSNFASLSMADQNKQNEWYKHTLAALDNTDSIKAVIVCCHHAPYTNSTIVNCNPGVQQYFVPAYIASRKAQLFITGHAHAFEHFNMQGKDFLVIGGGGGLHQPLSTGAGNLDDLAVDYKPMFHYLSVKRESNRLLISSHFLKNDFSGFDQGISFKTHEGNENLAAAGEKQHDKKGN